MDVRTKTVPKFAEANDQVGCRGEQADAKPCYESLQGWTRVRDPEPRGGDPLYAEQIAVGRSFVGS